MPPRPPCPHLQVVPAWVEQVLDALQIDFNHRQRHLQPGQAGQLWIERSSCRGCSSWWGAQPLSTHLDMQPPTPPASCPLQTAASRPASQLLPNQPCPALPCPALPCLTFAGLGILGNALGHLGHRPRHHPALAGVGDVTQQGVRLAAALQAGSRRAGGWVGGWGRRQVVDRQAVAWCRQAASCQQQQQPGPALTVWPNARMVPL